MTHSGVLDVPTDKSEEEICWNSTDEEGDDKDDDEGNDGEEGDNDDEGQDDDDAQDDDYQEDKGSDEDDDEDEGQHEEDEADKLYRDVNINLGRGIQLAKKENDEFLKTIDENMQKIIKEQVKEQVKVQVSKILQKIKQTMNKQLEAEVLTQSSNSSKTSYAVAADLFEIELKKILIKKTEGNKSIHRSNEQRNLYKALVEAYECDKIILDTYGDTVTLNRRHNDDADKDEEPSTGSY
nr:hypothetical protein [Tanacetum cinerariifolium]